MRKTFWMWGLLCGVGMGTAIVAHAQTVRTKAPALRHAALRSVPSPGPADEAAPGAVEAQWRDSFDAFAAADRAQAPQPGGVVFVGSSSIRLWDGLETQFGPSLQVVKRGFGGSRMSDCARYLAELVLPHRPRLVVVYAGDNDLASGRSPQQVLDSFRNFVEGVHRTLPDTRIAYLSIKPSPLRSALLPQVREANTLIADYSRDTPGLDYIDIHSKMLDSGGNPRPELFQPDRLHLNADGYALWKSVIAAHLN